MARYQPPRERRLKAMLAEARDLMRRQRPLNARLRCQQILTLEPDHLEALMLLGALAGLAGDHEEALTLLARAAALRPKDPNLLNNLGNALAGMGQHDQALNAYGRALLLNPDHAQAHANRRALRAQLRERGESLPLDPVQDAQLVVERPDFMRAQILEEAAAEAEEVIAAMNRPPQPDHRESTIEQALRQVGIDMGSADRSADAAGADALQQLHALRNQALLVTVSALGAAQAEPAEWCTAACAALAPGGVWAMTVDDADAAMPWLPLGETYDLAELQAAAAAVGLVEVISGSGPLRELKGREVHGHVLVLRRPAGGAT